MENLIVQSSSALSIKYFFHKHKLFYKYVCDYPVSPLLKLVQIIIHHLGPFFNILCFQPAFHKTFGNMPKFFRKHACGAILYYTLFQVYGLTNNTVIYFIKFDLENRPPPERLSLSNARTD